MTTTLQARVQQQLDRLAASVPALALGYSGGGDSHALLLLASEWARLREKRLTAFIVDHGLREESALEALQARNAASAIGIEAHILRWPGEKPSQGIQAAARLARHTLLARAMKQHGLNALLLAHTRDDQAETVWMRLAASSGWRGCAAMRARGLSPVWPQGRGIELLRPLLDVKREELRAYLRDKDAVWIEDPSNEDHRFARVRTRRRFAELRSAGFDPDRLAKWSFQLQDLALNEADAAARLALRCVRLHAWGGVSVDKRLYAGAPEAVRRRLLDAVVLAVSGGGETASAKLAALDKALLSDQRLTGQGVLLDHWRGAGWIVRDPGAIAGRVDQPAQNLSFCDNIVDGRFRVDLPQGVEIGLLGREYNGLDGTRLQTVPGSARQSLLAFRRGDHILSLAGLVKHPDLGCEPLLAERFMHRLFAGDPPSWFDAKGIST